MKALLIALVLTSVAHAQPEPEGRTHARVKRIVAEQAGMFALGQAWYYRHGRLTNAGDWDLPMTWGTIGKKLTGSGWRFDDNGFDTNAFGHPVFGVAAYEIGRENGLGVLGSFAVATLDSGLWETFAEWREYGAINDMLMTSTAGVPLGETLHQLLHHHDRATFEIAASGGVVGARPVRAFSIAGEVAAERRVGFAIDLPFDSAGSRGRQVGARVELLSRRLVTTFDYRLKWERPGEMWDLAALVGIGPTGETVRHLGDATVVLGMDTEVVSGMVRPLAFEAWRAMHPTAFVRGSLQSNQHGYYHGIGAVVSTRIGLSDGPVRLGAYVSAGVYRAFEGADRYQEMLTADPSLSDRELDVGASAGVQLGRAVMRVEVSRRDRHGDADQIAASTRESSAMITAGLRL
jgi:hypothetical protein